MNNNYVEYILEILAPLKGIKVKKMFGGYGIYQHDIFFALIAQDTLYFKVDDSNRSDYELHGSTPFSYEGQNKKLIVMSYWQVPIALLENYDELEQWVVKAVQAAKIARNLKSKKGL